jgi:hypothetical protein
MSYQINKWVSHLCPFHQNIIEDTTNLMLAPPGQNIVNEVVDLFNNSRSDGSACGCENK